MPPPPILLPNSTGYQHPAVEGGLADIWKQPLESPTRIKARLDGLEMMEPVIGMQPESPTRIKARLDGLDFSNKPTQFVLPVSILTQLTSVFVVLYPLGHNTICICAYPPK